MSKSTETITQTAMTQTLLLQCKTQTSDEDLAALFKAVHALKKHIPCLLAVSAGENQSHRHRGFTHGIILHFSDETHLRDATQQPVYVHLFEKIQQLSEAVIVLELSEMFTFSVPHPENAAILPAHPVPAPKTLSRQSSKKAARRLPQPYQQGVNVKELLRNSPVTSVDARLQKLIIDQLGVEPQLVVPAASLVEDLNADSLDLVEYIMNIEQYFKVSISDDDAVQLATVAEMQAYLSHKGVL